MKTTLWNTLIIMSCTCLQKENESHKAALKGAAFKLNMHPKAYFDSNPYASDKPLGPKKEEAKRMPVNPFKPSSPGKHVSVQKAHSDINK